MKNIQQLIKKSNEVGRYDNVFPKTFIDAIKDRETGVSLRDILSSFNMYFLTYMGSPEDTRLQLPKSLRRMGVWITYVTWDNTVHIEWYSSDDISDEIFRSSLYWKEGTNSLVGDLSISAKGSWVINGEDTDIPARGEKGITPVLKLGKNNKFQVSYNEGGSYSDIISEPIITQLRVHNNKLQKSLDLGKTWEDESDYISSYFREKNNKIQISKDKETWEDISDNIAAWFRFKTEEGQSQNDSVGKIQISRDERNTWQDLSFDFKNNLHIKGYRKVKKELPSDAVQGDIYGVGPTFENSDSQKENPIYKLYVFSDGDWIDNGKYTSVAAGVVQELGDSETEVISQKKVTENLETQLYSLAKKDASELFKLENYFERTSNLNKMGYYNPNIFNKEVYGFVVRSNPDILNTNFTYGTAKVAPDKTIFDFKEIASIKLQRGKERFYKIPNFTLNKDEVIWIQSTSVFTTNTLKNTNVFIDNLIDNKPNFNIALSFSPCIRNFNEDNIFDNYTKIVNILEELSTIQDKIELLGKGNIDVDKVVGKVFQNEVNFNLLSNVLEDSRKIGYRLNREGIIYKFRIVTKDKAGDQPLKYGIADIVDNKATNFKDIGELTLLPNEDKIYDITPTEITENQIIWVSGKNNIIYSKAIPEEDYPSSFLEEYNENRFSREFYWGIEFLYYGKVKENIESIPTLHNNVYNNTLKIKNIEENLQEKNLKKYKNYTALGDSITWGAYGGDYPDLSYTPENQHLIHGKSYADYLSEYLNVDNFINKGSSGASIWDNFYKQANTISPNQDLITINFGVNDIKFILDKDSPIEMGEAVKILEIENDHPQVNTDSELFNDSILGRFRWCLEYIINNNKDAKIIFLTSPQYKSNYNEESIQTLNKLIIEQTAICHYLNIEVINLRKISDCFTLKEWDKYLKDFIHPLKMGYKIMAGAYYNILK